MRSFVATLERITECVTSQRLFAQPVVGESGVYSVAFGRAALPSPLRAKAGGPSGLRLDVRHWFAVGPDEQAGTQPAWRVISTAYEYRILDIRETELLVFHWQPGAGFRGRGPDFPHLHVSAALSAQVSATVTQRLPLDKRHVPTGIVTLTDVVRMLIAEFGIAERHRAWPARLRRADARLRQSLPSGG